MEDRPENRIIAASAHTLKTPTPFSPECIITHFLRYTTGKLLNGQDFLLALLDNGFETPTITKFALCAHAFDFEMFDQILEENPTLKTVYNKVRADIEFQAVYFNLYPDIKNCWGAVSQLVDHEDMLGLTTGYREASRPRWFKLALDLNNLYDVQLPYYTPTEQEKFIQEMRSIEQQLRQEVQKFILDSYQSYTKQVLSHVS